LQAERKLKNEKEDGSAQVSGARERAKFASDEILVPVSINPFAKNQASTAQNTSTTIVGSIREEAKPFTIDFIENDSAVSVSKKLAGVFTPAPIGAKMDLSLKSSVVFESSCSLEPVYERIRSIPNLLQCLRADNSVPNVLAYYRYPETELPSHQRKLVKKALGAASVRGMREGKTEGEAILWYKHFSDNWRKALVSAFDNLKADLFDCFFFVQENLAVYFELTKDKGYQAYLRLSSKGLEDDLRGCGNLGMGWSLVFSTAFRDNICSCRRS
jgi:hypothetical protein